MREWIKISVVLLGAAGLLNGSVTQDPGSGGSDEGTTRVRIQKGGTA